MHAIVRYASFFNTILRLMFGKNCLSFRVWRVFVLLLLTWQPANAASVERPQEKLLSRSTFSKDPYQLLNVASHLWLLPEYTMVHTLQEAINAVKASRIVRLQDQTDETPGGKWLYLPLTNVDTQRETYVITLPPHIEDATVWVLYKNGRRMFRKTGSKRWPDPDKFVFFYKNMADFEMEPGQSAEVFVFVPGQISIGESKTITLGRADNLLKERNSRNFMQAVYVSTILILALYNLLLYPLTKEKIYLYYFIMAFGVMMYGGVNLLYDFLPPAIISEFFVYTAIALGNIGGLLFTRTIALARQYFYSAWQLSNWLIINTLFIAIVSPLISFFIHPTFATNYSSPVYAVISFTSLLLGLIISAQAAIRKEARNVFLVVANVFVLGGGVLYIGVWFTTNYELVPKTVELVTFAYGSLFTGIIAQMVLLSLIIGKQQRDELQNKVAERTFEVVSQRDELARQADEIIRQNALLSDTNQQLQQISQEREDVMHIVAHDLRSPLDKISGLLQLIRMGSSLDPSQAQYLELGLLVADNGRLLINNLLQLNDLENQRSKPQFSEFNLRSLLESMLQSYQPLADRKNVALRLDYGGEEEICSDRAYLFRILDNLLSNAIKFTYSEKEVTLRAWAVDGQFVVEVKDQGQGIGPEDQQKLFVKFQRLTAQPTGGESSTGLGLSIVKLLSDQLGGSIDVNSAVMKGTTFRITFPIAKMETEEDGRTVQ